MEKILFSLGAAVLGAYIAKRRKLNPFFWFTVCLMLGWIALLGFICLPFFVKKKKKEAPTFKREYFITPAFSAETIWYYLNENDEQQGPLSFIKLLELKEKGQIQNSTYLWNETLTHWKQWENIFPQKEERPSN